MRAVPIRALIAMIAVGAASAATLIAQNAHTAAAVEKLDAKLDQRLNQMEENQRRAAVDLQVQKVEFAEFKGEVRALIRDRRAVPQ